MTGHLVLEARGLKKAYGAVRALDGVGLDVRAGEVVAVVGRSGSGKSTLAKCVAGIERADAGTVRLAGTVQMLWQDSGSSFNPRFTVRQVLEEPARIAGRPLPALDELLGPVGLGLELGDRRSGQLSGGQKARLALARALSVAPSLLLLDESLANLDPDTRGRILELLLERVRSTAALALVLVTHDIGLAAAAAQRIIVLEAGRLIEEGPAADLLAGPRHPETALLVGSISGGGR